MMIDKIKQTFNIKSNNEKGQSLVEMAIIAPLLIFFLLGIFEVGASIRSYVVLVNVNREITRYAVRPGYLDFSTATDVQSSYTTVRDWASSSVSGQLPLDFDDANGETTLIISHFVVDTGLPCEDINTCDCSNFDDPNYQGYTEDDLILHPGMAGQEYQTASFGPAATSTGSRTTRLDYEAIVKELAAQNNKFNCEVIKKGGAASNNNVIVTELFHDQPQFFGFPFISNPLTDPVPLYTHTSMRLVQGARGFTLETVGPVCMAHPITFDQDIFDNPGNPTVPQQIDAYEGDSPGNFGWITWNPDPNNNNANYVEDELRNPRLSLNDFTDVLNSSDHGLSIGDNVSTKPGVANSDGVDEQLQLLVGQEIIIPVYDTNPETGQNGYYHVSHFAKIRVDQICLPRNGSQCDGENKKQIKATFLGYVDDICTDSNGGGGGGANNNPVAVNDSIATPKNTTVVIYVLNNDSDPDGDTLVIDSVTEISNPFKGTIQVTNGGTTVTYAPQNNDTGAYTFSYTISDGNGGTATAQVTVTVTDGAVNNPPVAVNDSATTNVNTAVTINVVANDSDPDGNPISVSAVGTASNGSVVNNGNGTVTYTPNNGYSGADSFTYTISDGNGGMATATVSVTVATPNNPPVAVNDNPSTVKNTPVTINVISNDSDPDGNPLTVTNVQISPSDGSVTNNGDGTVTFTPKNNDTGVRSFTYTISDGQGGAATATVTVTINEPPTATPTPTNTPSPTPTNTPSPTPTPTTAPASPVTMEAEDMSTDGDYSVENVAAASGGKALKAASGKTGEAWFTFTGTAGSYNITVYYFDENDGQSTFKLYVNGSQQDTWVANQNLGSGSANSSTLTSRVVSNITLAPGDVIKVTGKQHSNEYARLDKVVVTPN